MDIVLEVADRFILDRLYATVLPATLSSRTQGVAPTSSIREPAATAIASSYTYHPASKYLSFAPTELAYKSQWARDNIYRQALSLYLIVWVFGFLLYFVFATLSYIFVFDKTTKNHPKYLKNQIRLEIAQTMRAMPIMSILTMPFMLAEIRGYSKLYDTPEEGPGMWYTYAQFPFFVMFTDFFIYWIHRYLHHPLIYKTLHKPHHKWIMPTPYASHAFHPVDGWAQSVPYHVFPFLFPLQKFAYVFLFFFINIWTILIHDGEYVADSPIINGAACHAIHHSAFNYNYGQFTTLWDRFGGSYRKPNPELFDKDLKSSKAEWDRQAKEVDQMVMAVEGSDDRSYDANLKKKN